MTRAPWVLPKPERAFPAGNAELVSTTLGWRLVNPRMPAEWTVSLGESNEQLQEIHDVPRDRQDAFAARSHQLAHAAWETGFYDDLVVPVEGLARDEGIRPDATTETLGALKPSFRPDGTITAGNASPLSDGASAVLLGTAAAADRIGRDPIARIAGRGTHAVEPHRFGYAPVEAANKALARAGIGWSDVGVVELNEAFAVQSLVCVDALAWSAACPTPRSSTRAAARSPSDTHWAPRAAGSSAPWPPRCVPTATAGAWPRSASAWGRAWPSCWRTRTPASASMTSRPRPLLREVEQPLVAAGADQGIATYACAPVQREHQPA